MKKLKYATNQYLNDVMIKSLVGKQFKPANIEAVARLIDARTSELRAKADIRLTDAEIKFHQENK